MTEKGAEVWGLWGAGHVLLQGARLALQDGARTCALFCVKPQSKTRTPCSGEQESAAKGLLRAAKELCHAALQSSHTGGEGRAGWRLEM